MPIYEYKCSDCGETSELLVGIGRNSDDLVCRSCGGSRLEAPVVRACNRDRWSTFSPFSRIHMLRVRSLKPGLHPWKLLWFDVRVDFPDRLHWKVWKHK